MTRIAHRVRHTRHRGTWNAKMLPAGSILAWPGNVADVPAGWSLCDGTGGTPDLSDKFIIAADGSDYNFDDTSAGDTSVVSVSVSTTGNHSPANCRSAKTSAAGHTRAISSAGSHPHTASGSALYTPPSYKLAYIMCASAALIPDDAIVWCNDASAPSGFTSYANLQDRFVLGQTGDTRAAVGSDDLEYEITGFSSTGLHKHSPSGNRYSPGGSTNYETDINGGTHSNHDITGQTEAAAKPPYVALLAVQADADHPSALKLIVAYSGSLGSLTGTGWQEADGTNGTRDCRGAVPIGVNALSLGATGGDMDNVSGSANTPTYTTQHKHTVTFGTSNVTGNDHTNWPWAHVHLCNWEFKKVIPYHALYFIEFVG